MKMDIHKEKLPVSIPRISTDRLTAIKSETKSQSPRNVKLNPLTQDKPKKTLKQTNSWHISSSSTGNSVTKFEAIRRIPSQKADVITLGALRKNVSMGMSKVDHSFKMSREIPKHRPGPIPYVNSTTRKNKSTSFSGAKLPPPKHGHIMAPPISPKPPERWASEQLESKPVFFPGDIGLDSMEKMKREVTSIPPPLPKSMSQGIDIKRQPSFDVKYTNLNSRQTNLKQAGSIEQKIDTLVFDELDMDSSNAKELVKSPSKKKQTRQNGKTGTLNGIKGLAARAKHQNVKREQSDRFSGRTSSDKSVNLENEGKQNVVGTGYGVFKSKWHKRQLIGRGQFGNVYLGEELNTGKQMAVKQVKIQSYAMLDEMIQEVEIMCRASFRNENVVACYGWSISEEVLPKYQAEKKKTIDPISNKVSDEVEDVQDLLEFAGSVDPSLAVGKMFNVFMEYMVHGSLSNVISKNGPLNEVMVRNYTRQLLLGIRSLHAAGIAHRDIKCQNLLLSNDHTVKVADFGSAKRVSHETLGAQSSVQGSVPWMSPEVVRQEVGKDKDGKSNVTGWKLADVWSIGCTVIEMATGIPPWNNHSNPAAAMYAIATCKEPPEAPKCLHEDGRDFLSLCFKIDPKERPSVAKLIYHDYMRPENVDENGQYKKMDRSSIADEDVDN